MLRGGLQCISHQPWEFRQGTSFWCRKYTTRKDVWVQCARIGGLLVATDSATKYLGGDPDFVLLPPPILYLVYSGCLHVSGTSLYLEWYLSALLAFRHLCVQVASRRIALRQNSAVG